MSKRKYEEFDHPRRTRQPEYNSKKHSLDSDEEDDKSDTENPMHLSDFEGEEEGVARQEGSERITAFNMNEEMTEGHFDAQGHFIWKKEKEIRDNWMDNIDWCKIKNVEHVIKTNKQKEQEADVAYDELGCYKELLTYMEPRETIRKTICRLNKNKGGVMSSLERLRRKKAGLLESNTDVTKVTELANNILTNSGNLNVYQETYEEILEKCDPVKSETSKVKFVESTSNDIDIAEPKYLPTETEGTNKAKEPELDMYADDFNTKEQKKLSTYAETAEAELDMYADDFNKKEEIKLSVGNETKIKSTLKDDADGSTKKEQVTFVDAPDGKKIKDGL